MSLDFEALGLQELIRLQNQLSQVLTRRFERRLAVEFTDVVGSSAYFARYGDQAGRGLQQRHFDLLQAVLPPTGGRIVDTAGDGAFTCFPSVEAALSATVSLQQNVSLDNAQRSREHQLVLRMGVHWGPVLTDGNVVTGDAVNMCSRVCGAGRPGEIVMTRAALNELQAQSRLRTRPLGSTALKGIPEPVELFEYAWRDPNQFPDWVKIEDTGEEIRLPPLDTITFGRMREASGRTANDVVITLPDPERNRLVSRWHFELRRQRDGFVLRPLSDQCTEVDGQPVEKGHEVPIRAGTIVRLGQAVNVTFKALSATEQMAADDEGNTRMVTP